VRLKQSQAGARPPSESPDGGTARESGPAEAGLLGSWGATRWQYASHQPARSVDVVIDLGATVTLSLSTGTYVLAWEIAGKGSESVGGEVVTRGGSSSAHAVDSIELRPEDGAAEVIRYRLASETLVLSCDASSWDFGDGEEPAEFVAVLVRL